MTDPVLIVGAGLSGLMAARDLTAAGRRVLIVDKGRSVGGRLATRRVGGAVIDHGAQFFTVRSDELAADVADWAAAGVVAEWCRGFDREPDGYPRYRVEGGMNRLAKHLESKLEGDGETEIVCRQRVAAVIPTDDGFTITYDSSTREPDDAAAVILTAPVPQSLEILRGGGVRLQGDQEAGLPAIRYHRVIALLAIPEQATDAAALGPAGARQQPADADFSFIADNRRKGISSEPAVTFHVSHTRSDELWDEPDATVVERMRPAMTDAVGHDLRGEIQVKRWRYAGPVNPWPERTAIVATRPGPLALAGDAFGGPKFEGAYLSGRAAAAAVSDALPELPAPE